MPDTNISYSQPSWELSSKQVELAVTKLGGHMAPVRFCLDTDDQIEPYYINPWHSEGLEPEPEVLVPLRGDFFCLPFGEDNEKSGESHPVHGESATGVWTFSGRAEQGGISRLSLMMNTKNRPGKIYKFLSLAEGQNAVYITHRIEGFTGPSPYGHHAILRAPETESQLLISQSPILFGEVQPGPTVQYNSDEYYSLEQGSRFSRLEEVSSLWKKPVSRDCSVFPDEQPGFVDLLATFAQNGTDVPFWTCAVNPSEGYLWFSLKNPAVLPTTLFWRENYGRHGHPWLGRNCCLGLEEVCGYFAKGLRESALDNHLLRQGIPTFHEFLDNDIFSVHVIQGVMKIPRDFSKVASAEFGNSRVTFIDENGQSVSDSVYYNFVYSGDMK